MDMGNMTLKMVSSLYSVGVGFLALSRTMGYYITTGLSFIPLAMYNGKKGKGLKWLFYVFYPGHLLLLYVVKRIIEG